MKLKRLFLALAFAVPTFALAQPLDTEDSCKVNPAAKTFWSLQYTKLVAHAKSALTAGDIKDARIAINEASRAGEVGCVTKPSMQFTAISRELAQLSISDAMLDAARMVAKSEYEDARELLERIAPYALKNSLPVPDGLTTLHRTAAEADSAQYLAYTDKLFAEKQITAVQLASRERRVCRKIIDDKFTVPERCKKYAK